MEGDRGGPAPWSLNTRTVPLLLPLLLLLLLLL